MNEREDKKYYFQIEIHPKLKTIWSKIGLNDDQMKEEINCLAENLYQAYTNFIDESQNLITEYQSTIENLKEEFLRLKKMYRSDINLPLTDSESTLSSQITELTDAITSIKKENEERNEKFEQLHTQIVDLFEELKIPESERGNFSLVGSEDLSVQRLKEFQKKLLDLQNMKNVRVLKFTEQNQRILDLSKRLNHSIDPNILTILHNRKIDLESLHQLSEYSQYLQKIQNEIMERFNKLRDDILELYDLLLIDEDERIEIPIEKSEESMQILKDELRFLSSEANERIPIACEELKQKIKDMEVYCQIPKQNKMRFVGSDEKEEIIFLHSYYNKLLEYKNEVDEIFACAEESSKSYQKKSAPAARKLDKLLDNFYSKHKYALIIPNRSTST